MHSLGTDSASEVFGLDDAREHSPRPAGGEDEYGEHRDPPRNWAGEENGGHNSRSRGGKRKLRTRGKLRVATLNMRGFGPTVQNDCSEKWMRINQVVRENKIAILALQETHLTAERIESLNRVFASTLKIVGSPDPVNQTGARGVAFVLNTRLTGDLRVEHREVVPGRAIQIKYHWKNNTPLKLLNIYAPNAPRENDDFWKQLRGLWDQNPASKPDLMMGDFNLVESSDDRLPMHWDDQEATNALRDLRLVGDLTDGWRNENPRNREYTYMQMSTTSQSRIDRIYVTKQLESKTTDWEIRESGIQTDHRMAITAIANYRTPHIGKGRWSLPKTLVNDQILMGKEELRIIVTRTTEENPQAAYSRFKKEVVTEARRRAKQRMPKLERKIKRAKKDLRTTLADEHAPECEATQRQAAMLQDQITKMEIQRFDDRRAQVAARDWLEGETISKYWIRNPLKRSDEAPRMASSRAMKQDYQWKRGKK
ncbi:Endonuclease/exonuclease/phosphatase [Ganoderma leucocontextum]|nr:Endonuclease/exonuclease/phosphatase [Ganoderma leucocontextum]